LLPKEHFEGRIELNGEVLVERVLGVLQIRTDGTGRKMWQGSFANSNSASATVPIPHFT